MAAAAHRITEMGYERLDSIFCGTWEHIRHIELHSGFFSQKHQKKLGRFGKKMYIFNMKCQNFQLIAGFSSQLHTLKVHIIRFIKFTSRTVKYQKYQFLIICHKMCITLRISKNQNYLISEGHSSYSECNSICLMCSHVPQKYCRNAHSTSLNYTMINIILIMV